jgi:hypothetical protein
VALLNGGGANTRYCLKSQQAYFLMGVDSQIMFFFINRLISYRIFTRFLNINFNKFFFNDRHVNHIFTFKTKKNEAATVVPPHFFKLAFL